jgi:hypothetical protein
MSNPRDIAAQIAAAVFDHVERERTFVRHRIEDVICDALMLGRAKDSEASSPLIGGAASQELRDAVIRLMDLISQDSILYASMPAKVLSPLNEVYRTLQRTGWKP